MYVNFSSRKPYHLETHLICDNSIGFIISDLLEAHQNKFLQVQCSAFQGEFFSLHITFAKLLQLSITALFCQGVFQL
jgi:hypothetical protein